MATCLPLDDGEGCVCVQTISYSLLCKYFRRVVLPAYKVLCADIYRQRTRTCERCGKPFAPSSNRQKYCLECGCSIRHKQKADSARRRRLRKSLEGGLSRKSGEKNKSLL
ncbi:MAG: cysteine-rich VLP protein [Ruminococcus sp.]